jgi:UDP-N-acetylglucosamine--N-acetylmuramyl-(pentapeptide) pyrophosphoryl-undecaprenol N-acetylglucosamine transferase
MRVVITGGGTGGHLYPALAVAEALQKDSTIEDLLYIGNTHRRESELIPQYGIPFEGLLFSGMPRGLNLGLLKWVKELGLAFFSARRILKRFTPDVVFGTGGYITAPVLLAARSLGIPYVVHEPDAYPGLVNRLMGRWATQMTCAFEKAQSRLKTRQLHVTGNPLRSQIGLGDREQALASLNLPFSLEQPILLVTGGSQGARKINQGLLEALPTLIDQLHFQIIHQTGETLFEEVLAACPLDYLNHPGYYRAPFITDMASVLALADIAICRSGSMSLSEMYQGGIPTILVPYPYAAADHQRQNALASQASGASLMIEDADFAGPTLLSVITPLIQDKAHFSTMQHAATALSTPHATKTVIAVIKSAASGSL